MTMSLSGYRAVGLVLALTSGMVGARDNLISNGSFEIIKPTLAVNEVCTNNTTIYPYAECIARGWTGSYQIGNGLTIGLGGASFGIPQPDPGGSNALILQTGTPAVTDAATQAVVIPVTGTYELSFYVANRSNIGGPQTVSVLLDNSPIEKGTFANLPITWTLEHLVFHATAGKHSLTLSGMANVASDQSAFVDEVVLVQLGHTTTKLRINGGPTPSAKDMSLTAQVEAEDDTVTPTGTVAFMNDETLLETVTLNGAGQASLTTNCLPRSIGRLTAVYSGDDNFEASASSASRANGH